MQLPCRTTEKLPSQAIVQLSSYHLLEQKIPIYSNSTLTYYTTVKLPPHKTEKFPSEATVHLKYFTIVQLPSHITEKLPTQATAHIRSLTEVQLTSLAPTPLLKQLSSLHNNNTTF